MVSSVVDPSFENGLICSPIQHVRPYLPCRQGLHLGSGNAAFAPWHQDQAVTQKEADSAEILTVWIPLVQVEPPQSMQRPQEHPEGLQVWPVDPRKQGLLLPHIDSDRRGTMIDPTVLAEDMEGISCKMKRGDLLLLSAYTPHRGALNHSKRVRWSIDLRFQAKNTPTGRPFWPSVNVRAPGHATEMALCSVDYDKGYEHWCRLWKQALSDSEGKKWHRPPPTDTEKASLLAALELPVWKEQFTFASPAAKARWETCHPCRVVNRDLGYPIVVCDDNGAPVAPPASPAAVVETLARKEEEKGGKSDKEEETQQQIAPSSVTECKCRESESNKWPNELKRQVRRSWLHPVQAQTAGAISGKGVFASAPIPRGALVGCYFGTVYTDEE